MPTRSSQFRRLAANSSPCGSSINPTLRPRTEPRRVSALDDVSEQVDPHTLVPQPLDGAVDVGPSPSSSQMIQPSRSPTLARRMFGTTPNFVAIRAITGSRTSSSGKVSFTRTPITGRSPTQPGPSGPTREPG